MGWSYLGILFAICLVVCLCGFYKYVYFLSIGYGFSVSAIGVALAVMGLMGKFEMSLPHYLMAALYVIYGIRLSGFLLVRELKNASYRKTLKEATGEESAMPIFVKFAIWIFVGVLYVAQTSPLFFRLYNGGASVTWLWVGIAVSALAVILEAESDREKSAQKAVRPDMVATKGLYKIVRCPNYFAEILFWTGVLLSSFGALKGIGQWVVAVIAYACIVFIMHNGAQRLEKRQMARYGENEEYQNYANSTPILIPLIPIYHLNKQK